MRTIQITIDESLLAAVDSAVTELGATRSAFIRDALQQALSALQIRRMEEQHRAGYQHHPSQETELDEWDDERVWSVE